MQKRLLIASAAAAAAAGGGWYVKRTTGAAVGGAMGFVLGWLLASCEDATAVPTTPPVLQTPKPSSAGPAKVPAVDISTPAFVGVPVTTVAPSVSEVRIATDAFYSTAQVGKTPTKLPYCPSGYTWSSQAGKCIEFVR